MSSFFDPHRLRLTLSAFAALAFIALGLAPAAAASSRIKDIADFEGVRDNMLVGYGLVVGLRGTGDTLTNAIFTRESLIGMLERLGVNARDSALKTENVAAVMVTGTLPPFAREGLRVDVNVSALGDSKSLLGGTLLVTPMLGADGEIYAVAQGSIAIGGFSAGGKAASVTKGVPTSGRVANGAIVEREVGFRLNSLTSVNLMLRNPDFTTAQRIAAVVNAHIGSEIARPTDPATVLLTIPPQFRGNVVGLLTDIEQLRVEPDEVARVVIDEQNGVIVMGEDVRISTVAIAEGSLTVRISEHPEVSQPAPRSGPGARTVVVPRTNVQVDEQSTRRLAYVPESVSLRQLVDSLNALGIGPRDMISILEAIKTAGALQADIQVM